MAKKRKVVAKKPHKKTAKQAAAATVSSILRSMSKNAAALEAARVAKHGTSEDPAPVTPRRMAANLHSSLAADAEIEIDVIPGEELDATLAKVKEAAVPLPASSRHPMSGDETSRETASARYASTNAGGSDEADEPGADPEQPADAGGGIGIPREMLDALRDASPAKDMFAASSGGPDAFHDFAAYEFLFDPTLPADRELVVNSKDEDYFDGINPVVARAGAPDVSSMKRVFLEICACARRQLAKRLTADGSTSSPAVDAVMERFRANLGGFGMQVVYSPLAALPPGLWAYFVDAEMEPWFGRWARETALTGVMARIAYSTWGYLANAAEEIMNRSSGRGDSHLFIPYSQDVVNFGLRLTYRQEWKSLGDQYGDVARTIPLGPRQTEKVSVKILKRNKGTRQMETTEASETESEVSNTVKSSSEIVEEASSSNKWHAEAELSGSIDTIGASASAKISGGASGESSDNSKNTKSRLGEAMQKSAHKMRRETKVTVATETEVSYQEERSSEITNPNDEIAVTYVYQRLQRKYEIHTYLAEQASVVYVPEHVPSPGELEGWIKRHVSIVGDVLLDPSYRDVLNQMANEAPRPEGEFSEVSDFGDFVKGAAGSMETITSLGGTLTNLFDATQKSYAELSREQRESARYAGNLGVRRLRFLQHVADNVLHYCRAVWSREDGEQRMMRYSRIMVPMDLGLTLAAGAGSGRGQWVPSGDPEDYVPLSKLVNPAGPIGYSGNYAVFYLRENPAMLMHNVALQVMSAPYYESLGFQAVPAPSNNSAGTRLTATMTSSRPAAQLLQLLLLKRFEVEIKAGATAGALAVELAVDFPGYGRIALPARPLPANGILALLGIELRFAPMPAVGDKFVVTSPVRFRDPELASTAARNPLPAADQEAAFWTPDLVDDMLDAMPRLRDRVEALFAASNTTKSTLWANLIEEQRALLRGDYHAYLLRKEHTRRFLVDTNSLVLNLIPGTGSALEPFKRAHRYIDVLREANEVQRRKSLIDGKNYGDPDVEKVVLIGSGTAGVAPIVGSAEAAATPVNGTSGRNP